MTLLNERAQLEELIERCTADEVITLAQAERMRAYARDQQEPAPRTRQLVIEAMGYLGGTIALAGCVLVGARYWGDLDTGWRLVVLGAGASILLAAGASVPVGSSELGRRLRAVLWLVSLGCMAGLLAVLADRVLELGDRGAPLFVASGAATYGVLLWLGHRAAPQQVAMMVAAAVTAATAVRYGSDDGDLPGLGVWGVGLLWILLGRTQVLSPQRLTLILGSVMAIFGSMLTGGSDSGMVLVLVTIGAVIAAAITVRDLILLSVGALGAFTNIPAAMTRWFPDSVAAALALVVAGLLLVVAAVVIAGRGTRAGGRDAERPAGSAPVPGHRRGSVSLAAPSEARTVLDQQDGSRGRP